MSLNGPGRGFPKKETRWFSIDFNPDYQCSVSSRIQWTPWRHFHQRLFFGM